MTEYMLLLKRVINLYGIFPLGVWAIASGGKVEGHTPPDDS